VPAACLVHTAVDLGASVRIAGTRPPRRCALLPLARPYRGRRDTRRGGGVADLLVHAARVAVLATGNEVRGPGQPLGPAGIPDANGPGPPCPGHRAAGAEPIDLGIAVDELG